MDFSGRKILVAVSGGIAAYKVNFLVRDLVKKGAEVRVILTPGADAFVTKITLSTLSKNPVYSDFYDRDGTWISHVELGLWADVMLVAPCTANTLAKMSAGLCDNLVIATYLSAKCPVFIAPAMDLDMYAHPTTKENIKKLASYGNQIIPAESGELASGLNGEGRMAEPETILASISDFFSFKGKKSLAGKKVLITAGPTYEAIDPVRFIGNHSSGKMGFALAEEAAKRGAEVLLVSGPVNLDVRSANIRLVRVSSASEMFSEVFKSYRDADIAIAAAAVADYAPKSPSAEKIKKEGDTLTLELVKNPDILLEMGGRKTHQFLAGFALETNNEAENALAKLQKKNLDMVVLNSLRDAGAGFKNDTNKVTILTGAGRIDFPLKTKQEVASDILDYIEGELQINS